MSARFICDGCNVREPHEHRCHRDDGPVACTCAECGACPNCGQRMTFTYADDAVEITGGWVCEDGCGWPDSAEVQGWQPIETAPKMRTAVLLSDGRMVVRGHTWFGPEFENPPERHWSSMPGLIPTHWMPLPTPPSEGSKS